MVVLGYAKRSNSFLVEKSRNRNRGVKAYLEERRQSETEKR